MKNLRKFLVVALLFLLIGCGNSVKEGENTKENKEEKVKVTKELDENVGKKNTDFNLIFINKEGDTKRELVLAKNDEVDFSIYTIGGRFEVEIAGEKTSLKEAMDEKISIEDLFMKINSDISKNFARELSYKDGGSVLIIYPEFSIVKFNTLDGNFDMYFTNKIEDINNFKNIVKVNEESKK